MKDNDLILEIAIKHCPIDHPDFSELQTIIAGDMPKEANNYQSPEYKKGVRDERIRAINEINLAVDEFGSLDARTEIVRDYLKQIIKNRIEKPPESEETEGLGD